MRYIFIAILFLVFSFNCQNVSKTGQILFEEEDVLILDNLISELQDKQEETTANLVIEAGKYFMETPYVGQTLEISENEELVVNMREMDCNTFAEYCLAIARTIQSGKPDFDQFALELEQIRYRDGIREGYPSRLHYFSDWIYNNTTKGIVKDISKDLLNTSYPNRVNFMSTHPESYIHLENNQEYVAEIARQEQTISARETWYVPKERIREIEDQLQDGDIVGITTNINGLDISHVAIIIRQNNQTHLLHASSQFNKVVISEKTLEQYLIDNSSSTGIMVARPI